ncbi:vitamin K epoxide reductase family protein [Alistipes sp. An31A]|uniref:vitamin K epoxide reductase family protein n=1 Tax=Alistipes sp. An31A TaxID=1965631 RepID=UPI001177DFCF|nr:vitamin K epoxide reductase family protein [Alistipes sp. An31A]
MGGFALSGQDAWMCRFAAGDCQIVVQSAPCTVLLRLGKHADCNAVFQSAGAKLFGWISLGELSLAYFATSLFWGLFLAENPAALFRWLDVLAIPFVVYSLGWQIRHRRWCTLCLAIDAVLLADFGVELFFGPDKVVERGLWIDVAGYCVVFACMALGIRRSVTQAEMAVEMPRLLALREHLLSDSDLFELQLARCREEPGRSGSASPLHNGVESGRTVTVVMNPSCPKCARVHRQLGLLGDCRVELLFAVNDGDHLSNDAALLIITTWITKGWAEADRQIGIWYERLEMIVRTKIHPQAISILQAHRSYCQAVGIEGTPTVLVDNRRLPDTYDVEDLKYLF